MGETCIFCILKPLGYDIDQFIIETKKENITGNCELEFDPAF